MKIIVLNCYSRNSLAVINALRHEYELIGGATATSAFIHKFDKVLKSSRLTTIFRHPDPMLQREKFRSSIIHACDIYRADAIIATGTMLSNCLSKIKQEIEEQTNTIVLIEDYSKLSQLADKWHCFELCQKLGIPAPRTMLCDSASSLKHVSETFSFPVIAKPRNSFASRGVHFFKSSAELQSWINPDIPDDFLDSSYIIQEVVDGELFDVTSCNFEGKVISMLTQKRIMTLYDFGGGGIVNRTTDDKELKVHARNLIDHLKWNGILEFDFIVGKQGLHLLECNPKIWGTTALTVAAGLNMPQQLVDLFVLKQPLSSSSSYEIGLQYKWLFPECAYHWFTQPLSLTSVVRRVQKTFDNNGARRVMHNLNLRDMRHLFGVVLNKGTQS